MKTELLNRQGCVVSFSVEVPKESMQPYESEIIGEYVRQAKVNGYRPGKAPQDVVVRMYRSNIKKEVLQKKLPHICREAFTSISIHPLSEPKVEKLDYDLFTPLILTAQVEVFPEFSLNDYKNMTLHRHPTLVSDEEVLAAIKNHVEQQTPFQMVEDREVQKNDFVIVDFEVFDDMNQSVEKKEGSWFRITDDFSIPEFSAALIGMKIGGEKELHVQFPENYTHKAVAGKKAKLHVALKGIRTKSLPEINDEYAKGLDQGLYATLDDYKAKVRMHLEFMKKEEDEKHLRDQIAQQLIASHQFELPPSLLKTQVDENYKNQVRNLLARKVPETWLKENHEKVFKTCFDQAVSQLKLEFVLEKIIQAEKLEPTEEELDQALEKQATEYGMPKEEYRNLLLSQKRLSSFHHQARIGKVNDKILSHAKIEMHEKHEHEE